VELGLLPPATVKSVVRVKERSGAWRQLSVVEAVTEASRHLQRGDGERALKLLEKTVQHAPGVPLVLYLLGVAQAKQKLYEPAISNLEKAVRADENNADYLLSLGEALMQERPPEAIPHLARAVELGSNHPEAYCKLATLLVDTQKPEEALSVCDLGLAACGVHPRILESRGIALKTLSRCEEALECLRQVEALLPQDPTTMINMAGVLLDLGRLPESQNCLERACALEPDNASAHYNLGLVLLLAGNYLEGFREYEGRWGIRQLVGRPPVFPQPVWDGSELEGRRILLRPEQGAGDTIQFIRYADFVRARGGKVILLTPAPLRRLMSWLADCEIAALDLPLPAFDVHCPLLSLPRLAATDKETIPPPAQFAVPSQMKQKWNGILGEKTGTRVGIVWAGAPAHRNDRNRSFACRLFAPLLEIPQVDWFSLQVGPAAAQLAEPGIKDKIRDLAPQLTDYAETAAAISQLDLLITADTSVAHLAGSLGTAVWMLIPFAPDWRWLLERDDSPWYPGMRLFRQQVAGDWESVMHAVANALLQFASAVPASAPAVRSAPKQADLARWSNAANLDPAWNERARLAADFIPAGATVLDLGCGRMALEGCLPPGCRYTPCDIVRRDERTLVCDFNEQPIPRPPGATHITTLGVLEYIHDWQSFLRQLRAFALPVVLSYCPTDFTSHLDRNALGWINHLSLQELCAGFAEAGFHLQSSLRPDSNQVLLRIVPAETRLPVRRRVLVMSYNNVGNFGDRLGFHLINSLVPAGAEVHHGHFHPWDVPPGDFDLLVLGIGNSVFHPILTDQLLELTRRVPRSVGIFGTQYREAIDRRRMSELLDRLTVWFARYEEDLLLYGAGRQNAVHLGDWLISAFPMTRWNRDETLHVGREVWNDLPLDRTIQNIQRYRSVVSERIHPLLCALTSAERVAYKEQREDGSGNHSGKFRSLLIDIFGQTRPESNFFEVPRDAVAAYRARAMRVMSGMPQLFNRLLELDGPAR
jgi:Flp pilus assembly protein TadD